MGSRRLRIGTLVLAALVGGAGLHEIGLSALAGREPISVIRCPDPSISLEARWQWALAQIPAQPQAEHIWIGFGTRRLMDENSFIGRWPANPDYPTLSELVYGVRVELPHFSYSRQRVPREVTKEVAFLFEVERTSGRIEQAQTSDISLSVPLARGVFFWLGEVDREQSLVLFQNLYRQAEDDELRVRLVAEIAETRNDQAFSFLQEVLQKDRSDRVRREAVHGLEGFDRQKSLEVLLRTVRQDSSDAVRREVVRTISRWESPAAESALIELAQAGPSPSVRREAIRVLGQRASGAVIACLGGIVDQDKDETLRRQALAALAQMDGQEALSRLLRIAKTHADLRLREEAIGRLRERVSPEVRECLLSIINGKEEPERIQSRALESLASVQDEKTLNLLIQVTQTHERLSIRRRAIEKLRTLGESSRHSPTVIGCLVDVINKKEESGDIRRAALDQLAEYGTKGAWDAIIQMAKAHPDPRLREQAIDKLAEVEERGRDVSPDADACLIGVLNNPSEQERIQRKALDALTRAHDEKTRVLLIRTAKTHANPRLRREAIDRLGHTEEFHAQALPEIVTSLESIVDDPNELEAVQRQTLDALRNVKNPGMLTYLKKTAQSHPNRNVRRQAGEIVAQEMAESWNNKR